VLRAAKVYPSEIKLTWNGVCRAVIEKQDNCNVTCFFEISVFRLVKNVQKRSKTMILHTNIQIARYSFQNVKDFIVSVLIRVSYGLVSCFSNFFGWRQISCTFNVGDTFTWKNATKYLKIDFLK
jgi:hypothetical protein